MAARTSDLPVAFRGNPVPINVKTTAAETWYAGSLIYRKAPGTADCTKTWATTFAFVGISPYAQTTVAGGEGIVYVGPYIAIFPYATTGGVAGTDEGNALYAEAAGDNYMDLIVRAPVSVVTGASLVGHIFRFNSPEVWVAIKPMGVAGYATAQAATVAESRF